MGCPPPMAVPQLALSNTKKCYRTNRMWGEGFFSPICTAS